MLTLICCPTLPLNVYRAFCPAKLVVAVSGVPAVIEPVMSLNALSRSVALPVELPCGSIKTLYVPVEGKVTESTNSELPHVLDEPSTAPSDFKMRALRARQPG